MLCALGFFVTGSQLSSITPPAPTSAEVEEIALQARWGQSTQAERQLRRWAEAGHAVAQRELATLLASAEATRSEALQWYARAASNQDAEAAYQAGEIYRAPVHQEQRDWARAQQYYHQAAQAGHGYAALALGRMIKNGEGTAADPQAAVSWFKRSAELGNAQAKFLLANAYASGEGITKDTDKALELLEESAEQHFPPAMHELALLAEQRMVTHGAHAESASHLFKEAEEERRNRWQQVR
jgi:hypothetical protein